MSGGIFVSTKPWTYAFADEHESNDSFAGATPMHYGSMFTFAAVAPGDTDTYKIYMRAGDVARVRTDASVPGDQVVLGMTVVAPDSTTTPHLGRQDLSGPVHRRIGRGVPLHPGLHRQHGRRRAVYTLQHTERSA